MPNIDELLNDPDFMALSEEEQNSFIDEMRQKDYGSIPPWQKVLSKASRLNPFSISGDIENTSDIGKAAFQTATGTIGDAPQNIAQNPLTTLMAGLPGVQAKAGMQGGIGINNLFNSLIGYKEGIQPEFKNEVDMSSVFEPQSTQGKIAGTVGGLATGVLPFAMASMPTAPSKVAKAKTPSFIQRKIIDPFRTKPLKQAYETKLGNLKGKISKTRADIDTLGGIVKKNKFSFGKQMESESFLSKEAVKQAKIKGFKNANSRYGRILDKIESKSNLNRGDFQDILENTLNDLKVGYKQREALNRGERLLQDLGSEFYDISRRGEKLPVDEMKRYVKLVRDTIPESDHALTVFYRHYGEKVGETVPKLKSLNKAFRKIYEVSRDVKPASTKSFLSKVATGKASPEELARVRGAEERLGLLSSRRAENIGSKYSSRQNKLLDIIKSKKGALSEFGEQKGALSKELREGIEAVKRRRIGAMIGGAGLLGGGKLFSLLD